MKGDKNIIIYSYLLNDYYVAYPVLGIWHKIMNKVGKSLLLSNMHISK